MQSHNLRRHGEPPFTVVVVHGGPGAGGEMAPVARSLAARRGVLEPIQTADTLSRVITDFRMVILTECGHTPWLERRARADFFAVLDREVSGQPRA